MAIWDVPKAQIPFGGPVDTAVIALFAKRTQRSTNDLSARTIIEAQPDGPHIGAPRQAFEKFRIGAGESID
jgi:hypothetical protein